MALLAADRERQMMRWRGEQLTLSRCAQIFLFDLPAHWANVGAPVSELTELPWLVRPELLLPEN